MGSSSEDNERFDDELRTHSCIKSFWIGTHEVSLREFREFTRDTGYKTDAEKNSGNLSGCWVLDKNGGNYHTNMNWQNPGFPQTEEHPVVCVSWNDAVNYANWLSQRLELPYRLPTEAEWEFTAKLATYNSVLPAVSKCSIANIADTSLRSLFPYKFSAPCVDGFAFTAPVAYFPSDALPIYDILGNAWEWTCSEYTVRFSSSTRKCSTFPKTFVARRGGGWIDPPRVIRPTTRYRGFPHLRYSFVGFRLASDDIPRS